MPAVIFDLDGTLVDSVPGIDEAVEAARADVAPHLAARSVRDHVGPPLAGMLRAAFPDASEAELDAMALRFRPAYDRDAIYRTVLFEGVREVLDHLAAHGVSCFIATNKPAAPRDIILDHLGLNDAFVASVSPDDGRPPFPHKRDAVQHLLAAQGLDRATTALVGDGDSDRQAARANGLPFFAAAWGYGRMVREADDAGLLDTPRDLIGTWPPTRRRGPHA